MCQTYWGLHPGRKLTLHPPATVLDSPLFLRAYNMNIIPVFFFCFQGVGFSWGLSLTPCYPGACPLQFHESYCTFQVCLGIPVTVLTTLFWWRWWVNLVCSVAAVINHCQLSASQQGTFMFLQIHEGVWGKSGRSTIKASVRLNSSCRPLRSKQFICHFQFLEAACIHGLPYGLNIDLEISHTRNHQSHMWITCRGRVFSRALMNAEGIHQPICGLIH